MEILAPVKNYVAARGVIQNGCDAIYFASPSFGARVNASIGIDEIKDIVEYARKYSVKSYVTFNIVVFDDEVDKFFNELDKLYILGIVGIIIQDFSLVPLIKARYSDLEIHASTQMHVHNSSAVKLLQNLGANRVVVPREMKFSNIRKLKDDTGIEIEAFVHGALCVSYSGQCYDSTLLDQKSANRGRCSQYCRMPQKIYNRKNESYVSEGNYPLSLKDLNNIELVEKYKEAGVDSLKIEGRLKEITYAMECTKVYKDKLLNKKVDTKNLEKVYNRGFTNGRIDSVNGNKLVNLERNNNAGYFVGEVVSVEKNIDKKNGYYKYVAEIKVFSEIKVQDNLRFINPDKTESGQIVEKILDNKKEIKTLGKIYLKQKVESGAKIYLTKDINKIVECEQIANSFNRKVDINIDLYIEDKISFTIDGNKYFCNINVEYATKTPTDKMTIEKKLRKTNNTPYNIVINNFNYNDDRFIKMSDLTILKDNIIEKFQENLFKEVDQRYIKESNEEEIKLKNDDIEKQYFVEIRTEEQYVALSKLDNVTILINNLELALKLGNKKLDYIVTPRVLYDDEKEEVNNIVSQFDNVCASELGALFDFKDKNLLTNFTFNTTNLIQQKWLTKFGVDKTLISFELNKDYINKFDNNHTMVNVYGKIPVMLMDYCPINLNKEDKCGSCRRCHSGNYYMKDNLEREFPLLYEGNGRISLYSQAAVNQLSKIDKYYKNGIKNFHFRLTNETDEELQDLVEYLKNGKMISKDIYLANYYKKVL